VLCVGNSRVKIYSPIVDDYERRADCPAFFKGKKLIKIDRLDMEFDERFSRPAMLQAREKRERHDRLIGSNGYHAGFTTR